MYIVISDEKLSALESRFEQLQNTLEKLLHEKEGIGDWFDEETIMKRTGFGKTKLYYLRRDGIINGKTIGKKVFYNIKTIIKLLERDESD